MNPTQQMIRIKEAGGFIPPSVHFHRRAIDGAFEIVGRLTQKSLDALKSSIGGEVVLDIQYGRANALSSVRFFRGHDLEDGNQKRENR